jgi:phage shock protein A
MAESMNQYTERIQREQAAKGEVVPAERTATEKQERHRNALRTEEDITEGLRENLAAAVVREAQMLERMGDVKDRDLAQALRAVADVKAKSLDGLLKITGRSATVEEDGNLVRMLEAMMRKGYLKMSVDLGIGTESSGGDE